MEVIRFITVIFFLSNVCSCVSQKHEVEEVTDSHFVVHTTNYSETESRKLAKSLAEKRCSKKFDLEFRRDRSGSIKTFINCYDPKERRKRKRMERRLAKKEKRQKLLLKRKILENKCKENHLKSCLKIAELEISSKNQKIARIYLDKSCPEETKPYMNACLRWAEFELSNENWEMLRFPLSRGCKHLDGAFCSNLFQFEMQMHRKSVAKDVFELAKVLVTKECQSGLEKSCVEAEKLANSCYSTEMSCKELKLWILAYKSEKEELAEQKRIRSERHDELVALEKKKIKTVKENARKQVNALNAIALSNTIRSATEKVKSSYSRYERNHKMTRCTPDYSGGYNCVSH